MTARHSSTTDFGTAVAAGFRLTAFLALVAIMVPIHLGYNVAKPSDPYHMPRLFHRLLLRVLGFRLRVHGIMSASNPTLFVANHSSYLDIPVLGALISASFVAKAEVASWPLFGGMAKLQRTVFIERRSSQTREHKNQLGERLKNGQSLILFPEGTSSDGMSVLPFKSGLFAVAKDGNDEQPVTVQPVSIVCTEIDGLPLTRAWRPYYAWYGDMTLVGHLWNVFKLGRFTVDVVFHPSLSPAAFTDRKTLAAHCRQQVAHGIDLCLTGRHVQAGISPGITVEAKPQLTASS